jgi:hypothetical protein
VGITILKSLCVGTESTFSTVPGASYSSYNRVPAEQIAWTPAQDAIPVETDRSGLAQKSKSIVGPKGGTVSFRVPLHGLSTAAAASTEAVPHPYLDKLLKGCAHGVELGTGTTCAAGWTTTTGDVASAAGLFEDALVLINGEQRIVTDITSNTLTLNAALSTAPALSDVVYAPAVYLPEDSSPGTVSLACEGDGYSYTFTGCKGTVQIVDGTAGQRPMLAFEFTVDAFTRTKPTNDIPALPSVTSLQARSSPFWWGNTKRGVTGLGFNPAITIVAQQSTEGAQGRSGMMATNGEPVLSARTYRSANADDAAHTDYEAMTSRTAHWQIGTAHTSSVGLLLLSGQLSEYPAEGDLDGLVDVPLTIAARSPTDEASPYLLHFF